MTTPAEARAEFLWSLATPFEVYRAISRMPDAERAEAIRLVAERLGVSVRTIQRRVSRYWPIDEPQEPGGLHELACSNDPCTCTEVILV